MSIEDDVHTMTEQMTAMDDIARSLSELVELLGNIADTLGQIEWQGRNRTNA